MKQQGKKSQQWLLVTVGGLLAASFGILHSQKLMNKGSNSLQEIPTSELRNHIEIFLLADDFHQIARILERTPFQTAFTLMQNLLRDTDGPVTNQEKVIVLLAAASVYAQPQQKKLFQLLTNLPIKTPVFLLGVHSLYQNLVSSLIFWAQATVPEYFNSWLKASFFTAAAKNDLKGFRLMHAAGLRPQGSLPSELLNYVVEHNKKAAFIPFLIKQLGANPNAIIDTTTPLIQAVRQKNKSAVQALLKHGANPELMTDPSIGTPAQIAFENNYTDIEMLLRQYEPL